MTHAIDKLLIRSGFDRNELSQTRSRHFLYFGIMVMLTMSATFMGMILLG